MFNGAPLRPAHGWDVVHSATVMLVSSKQCHVRRAAICAAADTDKRTRRCAVRLAARLRLASTVRDNRSPFSLFAASCSFYLGSHTRALTSAGMQTRSCDENSVRPSVCLSVRRVNCDKTTERYV